MFGPRSEDTMDGTERRVIIPMMISFVSCPRPIQLRARLLTKTSGSTHVRPGYGLWSVCLGTGKYSIDVLRPFRGVRASGCCEGYRLVSLATEPPRLQRGTHDSSSHMEQHYWCEASFSAHPQPSHVDPMGAP